MERSRREKEGEEDEDEDEEVSADDYKGTSHASESDEEQRRALQEKQQISALMKTSRDLLAIFTAKPSEERAHQPCTFGEVRAGFKALQMLLAGTLSDLIVRMNALTHAVKAGAQSRELTLREKLMLGIPVPELENLPADRGPYTAALSAIMARPTVSQIEQWTKVNYHSLFMEHSEWSAPYESIVMDYLGPLQEAKGFKYVLIIKDRLFTPPRVPWRFTRVCFALGLEHLPYGDESRPLSVELHGSVSLFPVALSLVAPALKPGDRLSAAGFTRTVVFTPPQPDAPRPNVSRMLFHWFSVDLSGLDTPLGALGGLDCRSLCDEGFTPFAQPQVDCRKDTL
eukprot:m51a1_g4655 hypothetical protein (341) ;mRNA; r:29154-36292